MADSLQISRNTVEQAYQQLLAEGYLFSRPRRGYYVERINPAFIQQYASSAYVKEKEQIQDKGMDEYRYNFCYGKLDYRYAPFKIWKNVMMECYGEEMDGLVSYGGHQGESGLREQIAGYAAEYRGVTCNPEQVVVGAGTLYCLGVLANLLRGTNPTVGFEDPGYGKARLVFKNAGFKVLPISVEQDGINIRELAGSEATVVYVTPSHQFPTGVIMSISKRLQLLEWSIKKQGVIIEDDYSCHFRYNVKPVPSLQGIEPKAQVVYLGNFSKPLLPSLRIAFMVLPPLLLVRYKTIYQKYNTTVPYLFQRTLERFVQQECLHRHLRRVLQVYKKKHDCLVQSLTKEFGSRIEIGGKNAGLFVTITVDSDLFEPELIQRAAKLGVRVYPLSDHWERKQLYNGKTVLLGYSSLDIAEIEQGVRLLRKAWFG
ncbi:HTH-type transcriptional regulatory protein GabR [Sporomusa acidovorans DSM 3132]|uniref:HTH-type transcriptional regulatory protein GabR n=2 Tax=Sporomusa TaxID=2375 RepID=A0ABZ3IXL8_SPOA4|nr:HTH-type transcriptional regulatory protein GabR [Sporomusa acidovorans DSM 3132]SDE41648.1 GntR family transcriptional regulator / MocR family aminotransferase [Sporomusa acidovorans]